jgi:dUTP pyrophosphatase
MQHFVCSVCGGTSYHFVESISMYKCHRCTTIFTDPERFSLPKIPIKRINDNVKFPTKAHNTDAAWDIYSNETLTLHHNEIKIIKTGLIIELPKDFEAQIRCRSGMATKGISVVNSPGTIDAGYRGEIGVILRNNNERPYEINTGDRIAQMVIQQNFPFYFKVVNDVNDTTRGDGGFGSSGI